jgi:type IV secretory pathway VirD2 relaxase
MEDRADNPFEPRMGRPRSGGGYGRAKSFLSKARAAASKAGPGRGGQSSPARRSSKGSVQRRVIVKARFVRMAGSSAKALSEHVRYLSRDGAVEPGDRGRLFDALGDEADTESFVRSAAKDRHHFRLIVSPEDGHELADLKSHVRELMSGMETDLGTRLDWVAAVHTNTEHPHAHIAIRGVREDGRDLVMPRRYISHGIRERAEAQVTRELGPETQHERDLKLARQTGADRHTRIDRALRRLAGPDGALKIGDGSPAWRSVHLARLSKLRALGLANEEGRGRWRLAPDMEATLRSLGERGDIIKSLHRAMKEKAGRKLDPDGPFRGEAGEPERLLGRIVWTGLSGEGHDQAVAVVDLADGRAVQVAVASDADVKRGMIVSLSRNDPSPKPSDRTVADIASRHGGLYSPALHQASDPRAGAAFVAAHVRRLEALRRAGIVERHRDGSWRVCNDHLQRIERWHLKGQHRQPAQMEVESWVSLDDQVHVEGLSWLDGKRLNAARTGFGAELNDAAGKRRAVLVARGILKSPDVQLTDDQTERLRNLGRESAGRIAAERFGKPSRPPPEQGRIEGRFAGTIETPAGRLAVIDRGRDLTLVPWRGVMERARGQAVSGVVRQAGINWTLGKGRGR